VGSNPTLSAIIEFVSSIVVKTIGLFCFVTSLTLNQTFLGGFQVTIEDGISAFMLSRKAQGATRKTILYYNWSLGLFEDFLKKKKINELEKITSMVLREYLVESQQRVKLTSVRTYFRAIKAFFNFLVSEEYLKENSVTAVKMPAPEQKIPRTFNAKEIKLILGSFDKNDFLGYRNYSIMATLFATGLRRQELLDLKLKDINFDVDLIRVRDGKGRKERFVPLSRSLRKILLAYLRQRQAYLEDRHNEYVWINARCDNLHANGLQSVFVKLKEELNIGRERISPHSWRHTFAKNYLFNGGDIFSLQKVLGHSDVLS
jgi:site-specific recombinase XerD